MSRNVLVVAAHPDDEILMCGATIAKHVRDGDRVNVCIVAEGATSRNHTSDEDVGCGETERLKCAARKAGDVLGVSRIDFCGLPDQMLDAMPLLDVVKIVEDVISRSEPEIIYTHHGGDLNKDHRIVHQAVMTAARPLPKGKILEIYSGETPSSTEWSTPSTTTAFAPSRFVDVSEELSAKIHALKCYDMEMREFPHARSLKAIEALAHFRGLEAGTKAAEAFMILRRILL